MEGLEPDDDARALGVAITRGGRRLLVADGLPHRVGDLLVRRVERQRELVVRAQFGVVEDARRPRPGLLAARDRVPVALAADRLDPVGPGWRDGGREMTLHLCA